MPRFRSAWLGALVPLVFAACPKPIAPPPDAFREPAPLLQALQRREPPHQSLSAEARVAYYGPDGVLKVPVVLAVKRPASLFMQALSPSGDPLAVLATDGIGLTHYERGSSVCAVGLACPANLGRILPLRLAPRTLVALLLGEAPRIAAPEQRLTWDSRRGAYALTLIDAAGQRIQDLRVRPGDLLPVYVALRQAGRELYRVEFSRFASGPGGPSARRIELRLPGSDTDLRIDVREVNLDPPLEDGLFQFQCPRGTRRYALDCASGLATPLDDETEAP